MNVLEAFFYFASAVALVALPFLLVNWASYIRSRPANKFSPTNQSRKFPVKSTIIFVAAVLIAIVVAETMASLSRAEAVTFIQQLSGNYRVSVNHQPVTNPDGMIAALKQISPELAHHSHPTKRIRVEIQTEKGDWTLELGRDSDFPQEYWVFYPKYRVTSNNEIGRITAPVFDEY